MILSESIIKDGGDGVLHCFIWANQKYDSETSKSYSVQVSKWIKYIPWTIELKHVFVKWQDHVYDFEIMIWNHVSDLDKSNTPLVQRFENELHFLYSQIFINSFSQQHVPIFRPNLLNFPWNLMEYHFSIAELVVKRSRSTQGHHLNNLGSTKVSMLHIPSNKAWCWSKRCLMFFTIYGHGSHLACLPSFTILAWC